MNSGHENDTKWRDSRPGRRVILLDRLKDKLVEKEEIRLHPSDCGSCMPLIDPFISRCCLVCLGAVKSRAPNPVTIVAKSPESFFRFIDYTNTNHHLSISREYTTTGLLEIPSTVAQRGCSLSVVSSYSNEQLPAIRFMAEDFYCVATAL